MKKHTFDYDLIDDTITDSFLLALKNINTYKTLEEGGAKVKTWLTQIAVNSLRLKYKKEMRLPKTSLDTIEGRALYYMEDKEETIPQLKAKVIKEVIRELPKMYKDVLELRDIQGLSYLDIEERLNVKLSNVKNRIRLGRKIVRKKVKERFLIIDKIYG